MRELNDEIKTVNDVRNQTGTKRVAYKGHDPSNTEQKADILKHAMTPQTGNAPAIYNEFGDLNQTHTGPVNISSNISQNDLSALYQPMTSGVNFEKTSQ